MRHSRVLHHATPQHLLPAAQQVVVHGCELHGGFTLRNLACDALDGRVQIEQQRTLTVVANHALNPEERGDACASRDGPDVVQAGRRIQHEMSCRQLDAVNPVGVLDHQLPAVVFRGLAEEQRR